MTPFELFEKTVEKINAYQGKKGKKTLDINLIEGYKNDERLSEACKTLHKFIREDLDEKCFKSEFEKAYAFDQWKRTELVEGEAIPLGYANCWGTKDKNKYFRTICGNCFEKVYVYGADNQEKVNPQKAELDHFLTRLLFESANGNHTALKGNIQEQGLFILAAEAMDKPELANKLKKASIKMSKAIACERKAKEKIKEELSK